MNRGKKKEKQVKHEELKGKLVGLTHSVKVVVSKRNDF
jgi:hypothetical protein